MKPNTSQNKQVVQTLSSQPNWQLNLTYFAFLLDKFILNPCPINYAPIKFFLCVCYTLHYIHASTFVPFKFTNSPEFAAPYFLHLFEKAEQ